MTSPFFTIIVPTLNRSNTLRHTLRSIGVQKFEELEVIVSDNFSSDDTRLVVDESGLQNLRYVNPGRQLSMSRHWEFALEHATGRYIAFLGDDDGIVIGGLERVAALIKDQCFPEALGGINVEYHWPDSPIPFHESICRIPIEHWLQRRNARLMLRLLKANTRNYTDLPMIYRAFVSREVIGKIKAKTGVFFRSSIPDVYAAIAVAASIESYVFTSEPFFIEGVSGHSNGARTLAAEDPAADKSFFASDSIPFHPRLPYAPSIPFLTAECLLQARDAGLLGNDDMMTPWNLLVQAAQESTWLQPLRNTQTWAAIEELATREGLGSLVPELKKRFPSAPWSVSPLPDEMVTIYRRNSCEPLLQLQMERFGCRSLLDCMELIAGFTSPKVMLRDPIAEVAAKVVSLENSLHTMTCWFESTTRQLALRTNRLNESMSEADNLSLQLVETKKKLVDARRTLSEEKLKLKKMKGMIRKACAEFAMAIGKLYHSRRWKCSRLFTFPFWKSRFRSNSYLDDALEKLKRVRDYV